MIFKIYVTESVDYDYPLHTTPYYAFDFFEAESFEEAADAALNRAYSACKKFKLYKNLKIQKHLCRVQVHEGEFVTISNTLIDWLRQ